MGKKMTSRVVAVVLVVVSLRSFSASIFHHSMPFVLIFLRFCSESLALGYPEMKYNWDPQVCLVYFLEKTYVSHDFIGQALVLMMPGDGTFGATPVLIYKERMGGRRKLSTSRSGYDWVSDVLKPDVKQPSNLFDNLHAILTFDIQFLLKLGTTVKTLRSSGKTAFRICQVKKLVIFFK